MGLPILTQPTFTIKNPANDSDIVCRPMLVKEEKILLMAKQSDDRKDILNAVKNIVSACVEDKKFNVNQIPFFALEYLFIKIREQSISNKAKVSYQDEDENEPREFEVDLSEVELKKTPGIKMDIELQENISIRLKYPTVALYTSSEYFKLTDSDRLDYILQNSIDKIFEGDKTHDCKTAAKGELVNFVNSIPAAKYKEIEDFFNKIPTLYYEINYTNNAGTERKIVLSTLDDFFTFV